MWWCSDPQVILFLFARKLLTKAYLWNENRTNYFLTVVMFKAKALSSNDWATIGHWFQYVLPLVCEGYWTSMNQWWIVGPSISWAIYDSAIQGLLLLAWNHARWKSLLSGQKDPYCCRSIKLLSSWHIVCVCTPFAASHISYPVKPMRVLKFASTFPHDVLFLNPNPARPKRPGNKVSDGFLQTTVFKSSTGSTAPISGQWSCSLHIEMKPWTVWVSPIKGNFAHT